MASTKCKLCRKETHNTTGRLSVLNLKKFSGYCSKRCEHLDIDFEGFVKRFKPIKNKIVKGAPIDGYMFDTYGSEKDYVERYADKHRINHKNGYHIWTIVDGDGRDLFILNGWYFVNKLGYIITSKAWKEGDEYEVKV